MMQPFDDGMAGKIALTLSALTVYPVKSCRGIAVTEARLGRRGLEYDREWMVVDESGRFITQREVPGLARVETALTSKALVLRHPGEAELKVPLEEFTGGERHVTVWRDTCHAQDVGDPAAAWLSGILGRPVRMVRFHPDHRRPCDPRWVGSVPSEAAFADDFPLLVLSEESLSDLNQRISGGSPLPMNRFRPNVVVRGGAPYVEDAAPVMRAGRVELRMVKPCVRCRITTTDQTTASVGVEPLRTLATYRRHAELGGVVFGQNAIIAAGVGEVLRVGMPVEASNR